MAPAVRRCARCGTAPVASRTPDQPPHANVKYCAACRATLLRQPRSTMTPAQREAARPLRGTITRKAIARTVGCDPGALNRWLREEGLKSKSNAYPPDVADAVTAHYVEHGKRATAEAFPDVRVRSIVERTPHAPRQVRWQPAELVELARMAGLVSKGAQAHWLQRPNAYNGSISSAWHKIFGCHPSRVNGLRLWAAWPWVTPGVLVTAVKQQEQPGPAAVVLWLDLVASLRPDLSDDLREAFHAMAAFQARLHGTDDTNTIRAMVREREERYALTSSPTTSHAAD